MSVRLAMLALLLSSWLTSIVRAGDDKIRVAVVVILASETSDKVDPKLECVAREARKRNSKLTGFRLAQTCCKPLTVGTTEVFDLGNKQQVTVLIQEGIDKDNRVRLKVTPPSMSEIVYTTCCGKYLPIFTPIQNEKGELLIIAVCVQPCHGKCGLGFPAAPLHPSRTTAIPPAGAASPPPPARVRLPLLLPHRPGTPIAGTFE
jgi:hypothetical protein